MFDFFYSMFCGRSVTIRIGKKKNYLIVDTKTLKELDKVIGEITALVDKLKILSEKK
jgi:hypothetical protein